MKSQGEKSVRVRAPEPDPAEESSKISDVFMTSRSGKYGGQGPCWEGGEGGRGVMWRAMRSLQQPGIEARTV